MSAAMRKKTAVISGAASGIGAASARRFAAEGYNVALIDIAASLSGVAKELSAVTDVLWEVADVSHEERVRRWIGQVRLRFGGIDVLNNNAGIVLVAPAEESRMEDVMRVFQVNFGGMYALSKAVIPCMKEQKSGAIVNLGSISGHVGQMQHAVYGASKAAVIAFTRAAAWELADFGIRVNSVSPGSVDTPMLRGDVMGEARRLRTSYEALKAEREREQAFNRWADPDEIANAIYFLACDQSSFITGTDLLVDCGWAAK